MDVSPYVWKEGKTSESTPDRRENELDTNWEPPESVMTVILYTVGPLVDGKVNGMCTRSKNTEKPP